MITIQPANFLTDLARATRKPHRVRMFFALIFFLFCAGTVLLFTRSLIQMSEKTQRAKDHLLYGVTLAENQQFSLAATQIVLGRRAISDVQSLLRPWKWTAMIPLLGRQVRAFDHATRAIDRLSVAFDRAVRFADTLVHTIAGDAPLHLQAITTEQKRLFLAQLLAATPLLHEVKSDIDSAALSLAQIPDRFLLPPLARALLPLQQKVLKLQHTIGVSLPLLEALPLVSGYPRPQRYLFLFQNNDELRPTGGFIGTYGILELRDGDIQSLFTDNIYRLDRLAERSKGLSVAPPAPLAKYLHLKKWFLRDANWSPDFPTAAVQMLWFYQKESNDRRPIDGVLAVTPTVLVRLLRLLGPMTVGNVHFTSENVVDALQFHVEKGYDAVGLPDIERKEIIGKLTKEIVDRLLTLPLSKLPDLLDIIASALRERHIMLYETNPALQNVVVSKGWDGAMKTTDNDFLMVVDANLAALKTDSVMQRSLTYSVVQDSGRLKARLQVTYANTGLFSWKTTRYRTYTRIYVPEGARLLSADGFVEDDKKRSAQTPGVNTELGKTVFGGYIIVEPKETKTITLDYLLPERIGRNNYTLFVQKQAGTEAHPLRVNARFGTRIKGWQPTGFTVERKGDTITFPTDLRVDRQFQVEF